MNMAFGVSNSFKRGIVKTYSRQRARIENNGSTERPRKRIRMDPTGRVFEQNLDEESSKTQLQSPQISESEETRPTSVSLEETASSATAPSSPPPPDRALLSSDNFPSESELSSLPSSPPLPPAFLFEVRKPTFSFLKRKRPNNDVEGSTTALADITPNAQKKPRAGKKALTQTQIDLGGEVRKKCRACGMEYVPSVREDSELHREFCGMNVGGIEVGRSFCKDDTAQKIRSEKVSLSEKDALVMVDRRSSVAAKNKVQRVLAVVNAELGSVDIDADQLWSDLGVESGRTKSENKRRGFYGQEKSQDQFKAFLHVSDGRCIAFCLAQKISNAFPVLRPEQKQMSKFSSLETSKSSSISHSLAAEVVLLGISRIWTSKTHRNKGLASNLLECARNNFFFGVQIPLHLIAFSQPTESGARLAEHWFEAETGWHVYQNQP